MRWNGTSGEHEEHEEREEHEEIAEHVEMESWSPSGTGPLTATNQARRERAQRKRGRRERQDGHSQAICFPPLLSKTV
jgi:hypothetical protein